MAGNGVVLKPSPHAALCGERIARVFARAGLPEGLLRVVHGDAGDGRARSSSRRSTRCASPARPARRARRSARRARGRSSAASLELAGNDAMLVLADATLERAIARRGVGRVRQRRPVRRRVERAYVCTRSPSASSAASSRGRARCASAIRPTRDGDRAARRQRARSSALAALIDDAVEQRRDAALRRARRRRRRRRVLRARRADRRRAARCGSGARTRPGPVLVVARGRAARTRRSARANAGEFGLGASVWTRRPLQGRADRARAARRDGVDERPPGRAQGAAGAVGRRQGLGHRAARAARSRCASAPSPRSSPGTRRAGGPAWWFPYDETLVTRGARPSSACARPRRRPRPGAEAAAARRSPGRPGAGRGRCAADAEHAGRSASRRRAARRSSPRAASRRAVSTDTPPSASRSAIPPSGRTASAARDSGHGPRQRRDRAVHVGVPGPGVEQRPHDGGLRYVLDRVDAGAPVPADLDRGGDEPTPRPLADGGPRQPGQLGDVVREQAAVRAGSG